MILQPTIARALKPVGKIVYKGRKYLPGILTGLGIAGYGASVYFAAKAPEKGRAAQEAYAADGDKKKFIRGYCKAWGPAMGLFCVSTASVLGGHYVLRGRYLAAGAALTATQGAFRAYRERVIAEQGPDADIRYRHGLVEKVDLVEEEGKEGAEAVKTLEQTAPIDPHDYYIHVFDERNSQYVSGQEMQNLARMKMLLSELNTLFEASIDGKLTLKDALVKTGFKYALADKKLARFAGRVGWDRNSARGDHYISFGPMFERILNDPRDYILGRTPPLIIEFNCDGDIYG